jgi:cold shock CspA family protein
MQVPLEVTYRNLDKTAALETLIQEKVAKLEEVCDHISSCRVAVEKVHDQPDHGSPFRVRVDLTVPPGHELAVAKNPAESTQYVPLESVVRSAFDAARKQLVKLVDRQQNRTKSHPEQEMGAIVTQLFPEEGYGFLRDLDGQEIYFHRNSVLNDDFDRLTLGTGVHCFVQEGDEGPQASTVQIVSKPGANAEKSEGAPVDLPAGWQP